MDERSVDLLNLLPDLLKNIKEFQGVISAENPEFQLLWKRLNQALLDQFLSTAGVYGVSRWEELLKIFPKSGDGLEMRKFRILVRLGEQLPYTLIVLRQWLESACGIGMVNVKL